MGKIIVELSLFVIIFHVTIAAEGGLFNSRFYPYYHLAPKSGWMNDPNGFSLFQNEYHLFYQYNPKSSLEAGTAHWGHAKSKDLVHWEHLPIAMYPDQPYDKNGVFSGSAFVENNTMYLFYTGNLNHPSANRDHEQRQALAISSDGVTVSKFKENPIIKGEEHQPNIRDPKVWKHGNHYYMVLGNSFQNNTRGRVLLYSSKNMLNWEQFSVLEESEGSLGYMWECPDFFELKGRYILLFSPQGIPPQGDKYRNLYQTGYIIGDFDYTSGLFTPTSEFKELDHGHDFYATQTILDRTGRRILVAWFDMWEQHYPERLDGFTGHMTVPRSLSLTKDGRLLQKPIQELSAARDTLLHSGKAKKGTSVLINMAAEIKIRNEREKNLEVFFKYSSGYMNITYDYKKGTVTLDRGGGVDSIRRTAWRPKGKLRWTIYVDSSSVELFCGEGEVTFSSRFFPGEPVYATLGKTDVHEFNVYNMKRTIPDPLVEPNEPF